MHSWACLRYWAHVPPGIATPLAATYYSSGDAVTLTCSLGVGDGGDLPTTTAWYVSFFSFHLSLPKHFVHHLVKEELCIKPVPPIGSLVLIQLHQLVTTRSILTVPSQADFLPPLWPLPTWLKKKQVCPCREFKTIYPSSESVSQDCNNVEQYNTDIYDLTP